LPSNDLPKVLDGFFYLCKCKMLIGNSQFRRNIKENYVAKSKEIEDGVIVDFDDKWYLIGIEVMSW